MLLSPLWIFNVRRLNFWVSSWEVSSSPQRDLSLVARLCSFDDLLIYLQWYFHLVEIGWVSSCIMMFIPSQVYLFCLFCQHKHSMTFIHLHIIQIHIHLASSCCCSLYSFWLCLSPSDIFPLSNRVVNLKQKVYILSNSPLSLFPMEDFALAFLSIHGRDKSPIEFIPHWVESCLTISL